MYVCLCVFFCHSTTTPKLLFVLIPGPSLSKVGGVKAGLSTEGNSNGLISVMESQCSVSHSSINDIKTLDSVPVAIDPIPNEESAQCVGPLSSSSATPIKTALSKKRRKMLVDSDEDNTTSNLQDNQHPPKKKKPRILESDEDEQSPSNVALSKLLNVDDTNEFTCNSDELLPDITKARVSELQVPAKIVDTWRPVSSSAIEFIKSVMEANIE